MTAHQTQAILTDIEGTTSSLSFVHDILFPYAREHMAEFVRNHAHDTEVRKLLGDVESACGNPLNQTEVIEQLICWIDEDRKVTPLKALQGMIWEEGYKTGRFSGHVYEDAVRALRAWRAAGRRLYVFSSGSVPAQKLLFAYSSHGDLTPLFSGYFDTTTGAKREPASYQRIAEIAGMGPRDFLFLSDIREELDAARAAGMRTAWLVRNAQPDPAAAHRQVRNFDEINP
ncbi:MAG: acireductone synthase [Acidiferrobacterales bacterium]